MTQATTALLDALDAPQRARATFVFADDDERRSWAYFPRDHKGLPLHDMDVRQRKLAHALIASALSLHAHAKVSAIIALETVLARIEGNPLSAVRDPGRYFLSVFGTPGADATWGWRFEGHHVVLNFTIAGDEISPTPIFLGANPAEVRHGDAVVSRPCAEEEDVARDLLRSLDPTQRQHAILSDVAPPDFVLANLPVVPTTATPGDAVPAFMRRIADIQRAWDELPQSAMSALSFQRDSPRGLPGANMTASQQALLRQLVRAYVDRLNDETAAAEVDAIDTAGLDGLYFAWAGEEAPRRPHYYRLQSPRFLVEYDNTQDDANHVHAVWRDPAGDFGDALRAHLAAEH
jgi:hypothetical protein